MTFRRSAALPFFAGLLLNLAGCGGGSNTPGNTQTPEPAVSLSAASLTFATTTVGQTTAAQTVTVSNTGGATLTIAGATLSDTANFSLTNNCSSTLAASASCTLSIAFKPQTAAAFQATVTLTDNSGGATNTTQTVSLIGTGTPISTGVAQATLTPASINFPDTTVAATSATSYLTLSSTGTAPLVVTSGSVYAGTSVAFAVSTAGTCSLFPFTLQPGTSCTFGVVFVPTTTGTTNGSFTVTDNAGGTTGSSQTSTFTGKGLPASAPAVTFSPAALSFPDTAQNGTSGPLPVTVTNTGAAALSLTSVAITGGATATAFTQTNNCPATLAISASCTVSVTFKPTILGTFQAALTLTDNAASSPQSVALTGNSVAPAASLSSTALSFPTTTLNTTSQPLSATLTNTGTATLSINSITLAGTNSANFATTNTCATTLAPGTSCIISATFTPAAAQTYAATITVATNAATSPQTITLSGSGTTAAVTYNLYEFPDPVTGPGAGGQAAIYALADTAQSKIDMTMYAFQDTAFLNKLIAACARGVIVRVILDQNNEKNNDTPAYNALNAQTNCSAHWANKSFAVTHEKSIVVDNSRLALMSLNLQSQYYTTTRDWAMIYNDAADVAAVEATFEKDFAVNGATDTTEYAYQPTPGNDLIWSPTTARQKMLDIINNATRTLMVSNEELTNTANYITSALVAKCQAGLTVDVLIENEYHNYDTQLTALKAGGCAPHYYSDPNGFYVHAKAVVADYGLPTQAAYMGSINYSDPSMTQNRELGMNLSDPASVTLLYNTILSDYTKALVY